LPHVVTDGFGWRFDAIMMYSEEAKEPGIVPKAIVLALLIGGAIFFVAAWFSQAVFPTLEASRSPTTRFPRWR
jgi:putrescine importer